MYYVYILKDKNDRLYTGYTSNLKRRIYEHDNQKVYTTKRMHEPKLFYFEAYSNENIAKIRERKIKQYGSAYQGLLKRIELKKS